MADKLTLTGDEIPFRWARPKGHPWVTRTVVEWQQRDGWVSLKLCTESGEVYPVTEGSQYFWVRLWLK